MHYLLVYWMFDCHINTPKVVQVLQLQFLSLYQRTALHMAADRGHVSKVKYLVTKGADINIKDPSGVSI